MNRILIASLLVSFHAAFVLGARRRCPQVQIANGKGELHRRGRVIQYKCNRGYSLLGEAFGECIRGEWDPDPPVCLKPGCPAIRNFRNGLVTESMRTALLEFSCNHGYKLVGPSFIYCNGRRWSSMQPYCRAADVSCNFEGGNTCSWVVDTHEDEDFEWHVQQYGAPSRLLGTGPKHDHTLSPNSTGHYLMIETSDHSATPVLPARLFSPKFPPPTDNMTCFTFWYHMYGSTVGSLNVFLNNKLVFQKNSNHGDRWIKGVINLPQNVTDLQLMIEGTYGRGHTGNIGLDDFYIRNSSDCFFSNVTSCKNRCGRSPNESDSCLCTPECFVDSSCCADYKDFCQSENTASTFESEDYDSDPTETSETISPEASETFSPSSVSDLSEEIVTKVTENMSFYTSPRPTKANIGEKYHSLGDRHFEGSTSSRLGEIVTTAGQGRTEYAPTESTLVRTTTTRGTSLTSVGTSGGTKTTSLKVTTANTPPKGNTSTLIVAHSNQTTISTIQPTGSPPTRATTTMITTVKPSTILTKFIKTNTKHNKGTTPTNKYTEIISTAEKKIVTTKPATTKPIVTENSKSKKPTEESFTRIYTTQKTSTKFSTKSSVLTSITTTRPVVSTFQNKTNKSLFTVTREVFHQTTKTPLNTKPLTSLTTVKAVSSSTQYPTTLPHRISSSITPTPKKRSTNYTISTKPSTKKMTYTSTSKSLEDRTFVIKENTKSTLSFNDVYKNKKKYKTVLYEKITKSPLNGFKIKEKGESTTDTIGLTTKSMSSIPEAKSKIPDNHASIVTTIFPQDFTIMPRTTERLLLPGTTNTKGEHDRLQGIPQKSNSDGGNGYEFPGIMIGVGTASILVIGLALTCYLRSRRSRLRFRNGSEGDVLYVSSEEMYDFSLATPAHR